MRAKRVGFGADSQENFDLLKPLHPFNVKNFSFLPKTYFSPDIFKSEFPPKAKPIAKSRFLPKILGRNDTMLAT